MEKISGLIGKKFNTEPVRDDKYINITIKSYGDRVDTNFHGKRVPK